MSRGDDAKTGIAADIVSDSTGPRPVLHIITRLIVGGAQENTMLTAALLDPNRYTVDVISGPLAVHIASRPGDARHSLADVTAAQEALVNRAEVDFRGGLRRTVAWFREHTSLSE